MTLELHPLCTLFPRITGREFDELVADIKANGLREPVTVKDGMVLDGGNRYAACIAAGCEPETVEYDGADIAAFVLSKNLHRRHLTEGQRAAIVASAQDWSRADLAGGNRKSDHPARLPVDSQAGRAATAGVSERTQRKADKVAKAAPEKAAEVARGEKSLEQALREVDPGAGKKPAKKDQPATVPLDRHEALQESFNELADRAQEMAVQLESYADVKDSDAAKALIQVRSVLKAVESRRDELMRECAEHVKTIKYWRGRAEKAEAKLRNAEAVAL